jgi:hypothetical protein
MGTDGCGLLKRNWAKQQDNNDREDRACDHDNYLTRWEHDNPILTLTQF